jgi:type IV pilus assembly protein PilP
MSKSRMSRRMTGAWALALAVALAGCGESAYQDLDQFVKQSGQGLRGKVEPLPEVRPYEGFVYDAFDQPDPFRPRAPKFADVARPDPDRRREALEEYPLEDLKMVGTLERKGMTYALIRSPDNNLAQVKTGDYIGQNYGRVLAISEAEVKLREMVQEATGKWVEREASLQLSEEEAKQTQAAQPKPRQQ